MHIGPGDSVEMYPVPQPPPQPRTVLGANIDYLGSHSRLVQVLNDRWLRLHTRHPLPPPRGTPNDPRVAMVPRASVSLLARAYGDRLLIMHLPEISRQFMEQITPEEVRLEQACLEAGVPYISARDVLIRARDRFVLSRGFPNTTPGDGHLNETGHRLVAGVLWQLLENAR
jgi:hypothetical protein